MRAPPLLLLLLLLMAAAGQAVNPLARFNPWLSACDLEEGSASEERVCVDEVVCSGSSSDRLAGQSVAAVCSMSAGKRTENLTESRFHTCCERSLWTALDRSSRREVLAGGERCERTLHDLLRLDQMVARVHCDFFDILSRYDCDQTYSRHTCEQCQDKYRQWACSTMIPMWVEREEVTLVEEAEAEAEARRERPARRAARWHARHLERVGHLDRRRAPAAPAGVPGRWVRAAAAGPGRPRPLVRLKPCLVICQQVEQYCPYFLPADRAPAYPTQYAGEPTFLCLDERIPETGAQKNKSNYGSNNCCYQYNNTENDTNNISRTDVMMFYVCDERLEEAEQPDAETCSPVEERVASCSVPYQASAAARRPAPAQALALVAPLAALLLAAFPTPHARRTLSTSLVNVRDSRL